MSEIDFINAIKSQDLMKLKQIPKSDLHVHSTRGCNRKYFEQLYGINFNKVPVFKGLDEMDNWYSKNLEPYTSGLDGFLLRLKYLIIQNNEHKVVKFAPSFCLDMCKNFEGNLQLYINYLQELFKNYGKDIEILPELSIKRNDNLEKIEREFEEVLKYDFFKSIDLMGDEYLGTSKFIDIYKTARKHGLILKAHVGEFADAGYIERALIDLDLDCINHGLSLIQSQDLMKYVSDQAIMVNICPSSNILLSRINSYSEHPIKKFLDRSICCSINTDDELIFNQSIEEEYLNLYNGGCLSPEELYIVNQNGLVKSLNKRKW